ATFNVANSRSLDFDIHADLSHP
ncbi:MAG: hypothetical protein QOG74_2782, partial [Alphaproteobacteria bacterium]|nr:hypothetical protein [Alphaproteobacteria bacterium]